MAGTAPCALAAAYFGWLFFLGWRMPFYLLLQAAYGTWSPSSVLLALAAWAVALDIATAQAKTKAPYCSAGSK